MHPHLGIEHTQIVMYIIDVRINLYCLQEVPKCLLKGFLFEIDDPQIVESLRILGVYPQNGLVVLYGLIVSILGR